MRGTLAPLLRSAPYTCRVIATVSPVPLVQAVPAVTEAVVRSLIGPGDEPVEGDGHVENSCGHGVSFPGLWTSSNLPASSGRLIPSFRPRARHHASSSAGAYASARYLAR